MGIADEHGQIRPVSADHRLLQAGVAPLRRLT
jgi:hypothetical protein